MVKTWCDSQKGTAMGGTGGSYTALASQLTVKDGATAILGFATCLANSTPTSAQNGVPILRVNSSDLGISQEQFVIPPVVTDGIATNDKEAPVRAGFIPFFLEGSVGELKNAKITCSVTSNVTMTGGWDGVIGVVMSDQVPDQAFASEILAMKGGFSSGGDQAESDAGISAASAAAFTETIAVNSRAKQLRGLMGIVNPNGPTAGEATSGLVEFTSSAIQDFSPQRWPLNIAYTASLGTPVGTPVPIDAFYWPTRFDLPGTNFNMSVAMDLAVALSNAGDGVAAARWI